MNLVAGRDLQRSGLDLDEIVCGKIGTQTRHDPAPRQQGRPAVGMDVGRPKRRKTTRIVRHNLVRGPMMK